MEGGPESAALGRGARGAGQRRSRRQVRQRGQLRLAPGGGVARLDRVSAAGEQQSEFAGTAGRSATAQLE